MRTTLKNELIKKAGAIFVFVLTALGLGPAFLSAQSHIAWIQRYNGPGNNYDAVAAIAVDGGGNVYVTGSSDDSVNSTDIATIKYDENGNQLWVARYNGTGDSIDLASAIVVDSAENVYITGESYGDGTGYDCVTIKYHPNGDTAWVRKYNGLGNWHDRAWALKVGCDGSVYVTGYTWGGSTQFDYVTLKYDSSGNERWVRRQDIIGYEDVAYDIILDNDQNVYVTGRFSVTGIDYDYGTIKYDSSGNRLLAVTYGGSASDEARSLALDADGNIYVTGGFPDYATVKYNKSGTQKWAQRYDGGFPDIAKDVKIDYRGNVVVAGSSVNEYAIIKYDSLGNQLWLQRYDGFLETADLASDLALDAVGNVYVTGLTKSWIYGAKSADILTIKYDSDGNQAWLQRYNAIKPNNDDEARAIAVDSQSNVYVAGLSEGYRTSNDYDFIILKYSPLPLLKGDLDENGALALDDIVSLLNCVFLGSGSCPPAFADVNCDAFLTPADVVVLLLTFYASASPPC